MKRLGELGMDRIRWYVYRLECELPHTVGLLDHRTLAKNAALMTREEFGQVIVDCTILLSDLESIICQQQWLASEADRDYLTVLRSVRDQHIALREWAALMSKAERVRRGDTQTPIAIIWGSDTDV